MSTNANAPAAPTFVGEHFSVAVVGDGGTGKSSIINAFKTDGFVAVYKQTIGIDFYEKTLKLRGEEKVTLRIWDIGGQSIHSSNLPKYLSPAHAVFITYDVTNIESFLNCDDWLRNVRRVTNDGESKRLYLVGNKIDLYGLRQVKQVQHEAFVRDNNLAGGLFVSAKTGENVLKTFYQIAGELKGIYLTNHELACYDKVLKVHVAVSDDEQEGRTSFADEIEAEDRAAEERKRRLAEKKSVCRIC